MAGYIYILSNKHIPDLVKIGFTDRDPQKRAAELSAHTGVPGKFRIVHSWLIIDAGTAEKRVHGALGANRATGEFFRLSPGAARIRVTKILQELDLIGADGLSFEARKIADQEREIKERTQLWLDEKKNLEAFNDAITAIRRELFRRERASSPPADSQPSPSGWSNLFGLIETDTPSKQQARRDFFKSIFSSYADEIKAPWLFKAPAMPFRLKEDIRFQTVNKNGSSHQGYRIPAGTLIESSKGWVFVRDFYQYNLFFKSGNLHFLATGEKISNAILFDNHGAYLNTCQRIFVGEIPSLQPGANLCLGT